MFLFSIKPSLCSIFHRPLSRAHHYVTVTSYHYVQVTSKATVCIYTAYYTLRNATCCVHVRFGFLFRQTAKRLTSLHIETIRLGNNTDSPVGYVTTALRVIDWSFDLTTDQLATYTSTKLPSQRVVFRHRIYILAARPRWVIEIESNYEFNCYAIFSTLFISTYFNSF